MRVELFTDRVGVGFSQSAGEVVDLPTAEAKALIDAGSAAPAENKKESAMLKTKRERLITHRPFGVVQRETAAI